MAKRTPFEWLADAGQGPVIARDINSPAGNFLFLNGTNGTQVILNDDEVVTNKDIRCNVMKAAEYDKLYLRGQYLQDNATYGGGTEAAVVIPASVFETYTLLRLSYAVPAGSGATFKLPSGLSLASTVFPGFAGAGYYRVCKAMFEVRNTGTSDTAIQIIADNGAGGDTFITPLPILSDQTRNFEVTAWYSRLTSISTPTVKYIVNISDNSIAI